MGQRGHWCQTAALIRCCLLWPELSVSAIVTDSSDKVTHESLCRLKTVHPSTLREHCLLIYYPPVPGHFAGRRISFTIWKRSATSSCNINHRQVINGTNPVALSSLLLCDRQTVRAWNGAKWWLFCLCCPCAINPPIPKSSLGQYWGHHLCLKGEHNVSSESLSMALHKKVWLKCGFCHLRQRQPAWEISMWSKRD